MLTRSIQLKSKREILLPKQEQKTDTHLLPEHPIVGVMREIVRMQIPRHAGENGLEVPMSPFAPEVLVERRTDVTKTTPVATKCGIVFPSWHELAVNLAGHGQIYKERIDKFLGIDKKTEQALTYELSDIKGPERWTKNLVDERYEISDKLTLRRVDGRPVGWMPLGRYADLMGLEHGTLIKEWIGGSSEFRQAHPYYRRTSGFMPFVPTVNHLPVAVFPLTPYRAGRSNEAQQTYVTSGTVSLIAYANTFDEYALVDLSRMLSRAPPVTVDGAELPVIWMCAPSIMNNVWQFLPRVNAGPKGKYSHMTILGRRMHAMRNRQTAPIDTDRPETIVNYITQTVQNEVAAFVHTLRGATRAPTQKAINRMVNRIRPGDTQAMLRDYVAGRVLFNKNEDPSVGDDRFKELVQAVRPYYNNSIDALEGRRPPTLKETIAQMKKAMKEADPQATIESLVARSHPAFEIEYVTEDNAPEWFYDMYPTSDTESADNRSARSDAAPITESLTDADLIHTKLNRVRNM